MERPSAGNAVRNIPACAAIRRRLVRDPDTMTHTETVAASKSRSRAICRPSRRFRSTVPTSSFASTMSVFSSITSRARARVPGQQIDQPSLPPDRKGNLRGQGPIRKVAAEGQCDGLVKRRMSLVEHSIQVAAAPARLHLESDVQLGRHRPQRPQRQRIEMAALDPRDGTARDLRRDGDVLLAQPSPDPRRPKRGTHSLIVHLAMVAIGHSLAITPGSLAVPAITATLCPRASVARCTWPRR